MPHFTSDYIHIAAAEINTTGLESAGLILGIAALLWCLATILIPFWIWEMRNQSIQQTKLLRALLEKPAIKIGPQAPPPLQSPRPPAPQPTTARRITTRLPVR